MSPLLKWKRVALSGVRNCRIKPRNRKRSYSSTLGMSIEPTAALSTPRGVLSKNRLIKREVQFSFWLNLSGFSLHSSALEGATTARSSTPSR